MAALHHPGVADVYDYGETAVPGDDDRPAYIVMAWVQGQPLSERIAEAGRLDAATTLSVVAQTARALQAVHDAGVVHRDVKPANLVVEPDGTVVLIDFGVAAPPSTPRLTAVNEVVGTALYMAPEQISKQTITPATDIYALGAVAYHCLAGHPPFPGDNALDRRAEPPRRRAAAAARRHRPGLRAMVATAMAKDPTHRFPTAAAMADAARTGADTADTVVTPGGAVPAGRAAAPVRRHAGWRHTGRRHARRPARRTAGRARLAPRSPYVDRRDRGPGRAGSRADLRQPDRHLPRPGRRHAGHAHRDAGTHPAGRRGPGRHGR